MLLVLDTNIFLFAIGALRVPACSELLDVLIELSPRHSVRIPRTVVQEVLRHLDPQTAREFFRLMSVLGAIDEDFLVPFDLGAKYERAGLKPADAFIAAYAEWAAADGLVSQNRHFLARRRDLPFRVLSAEECLRRIRH